MKKRYSLLGTLLLTAVTAAVPAATAQTVHVAGASASSQFLTAAITVGFLTLIATVLI
jgi:hypothetical protein